MDDAVSIGSSADGRPRCRICSDNEGVMVSPCDCNGSIAFVHGKCLNRWIRVQQHSKCPICRSSYATSLRLKPMNNWRRPRYQIVGCNVFFSYLWLLVIIGLISVITTHIIIVNRNDEVNHMGFVNATTEKSFNDAASHSFELGAMLVVNGFLIFCFLSLITILAASTLYGIFQQWKLDNSRIVWANKKKKKVMTQDIAV